MRRNCGRQGGAWPIEPGPRPLPPPCGGSEGLRTPWALSWWIEPHSRLEEGPQGEGGLVSPCTLPHPALRAIFARKGENPTEHVVVMDFYDRERRWGVA